MAEQKILGKTRQVQVTIRSVVLGDVKSWAIVQRKDKMEMEARYRVMTTNAMAYKEDSVRVAIDPKLPLERIFAEFLKAINEREELL